MILGQYQDVSLKTLQNSENLIFQMSINMHKYMNYKFLMLTNYDDISIQVYIIQSIIDTKIFGSHRVYIIYCTRYMEAVLSSVYSAHVY